MESASYNIRPAGRHILTIGRDLIQDQYAAIVELVKNAYDADASKVHINIERQEYPDKEGDESVSIKVCITDDGHGMPYDTVVNKWLVPSTADKAARVRSPNNRVMQGRKGVGRYAASLLGNELLLDTTDKKKKTTQAVIDWDMFEVADFLSDVDILIESKDSDVSPGTSLTMKGDRCFADFWRSADIDKLIDELQKILSPVEDELSQQYSNVGTTVDIDNFQIFLTVSGIEDQEIREFQIKPVPIFDLYDYRIFGMVDSKGHAQLTYSNNVDSNAVIESFGMEYGVTNCGALKFDIRVYDRDPDSIERILMRGLKKPDGTYFTKLETRRTLNRYMGVGVYRNGFRIRPLGDPDNDWLKLDHRRIQTPGRKISSNQVIGYVQIEGDLASGLVEKSARDGLKNNDSFKSLIKIAGLVIHELEVRRHAFRAKTRKRKGTGKKFDDLVSFDALKERISKQLEQANISEKAQKEILKTIDAEASSKVKLFDDIKKDIAIYQGQATVGKIMNVLVHEGRKSLLGLRTGAKEILRWEKKFDSDVMLAKKNIAEASVDVRRHVDIFSQLFKKINPLATGTRGDAKKIFWSKTIEQSFKIFDEKINKNNIICDVDCPEGCSIVSWEQDMFSIFTNLIDNSLFWLEQSEKSEKKITVKASQSAAGIVIDFIDNGPGIEPKYIEDDQIFLPDFSTKPDGTGLGLAIAGEAAHRNGLKLSAIKSDTGAYFRLEGV